MPSTGEDGHVEADLGDDVLGGALLDPRRRAQQLNRCGKRGELLLDRC